MNINLRQRVSEHCKRRHVHGCGMFQTRTKFFWFMAAVILSLIAMLPANAQFTLITNGAVVTDGGDSTGCAWGDYDNDGYLDLFVSNFGTPLNYLYHNNGDGSFTRLTTGAMATNHASSEGAAWGDYDNDGNLDLFVAIGLGGNDF